MEITHPADYYAYMIDELSKRHPREDWVFAFEVPEVCSYDMRFIDAFACAVHPSKMFRRIAYELKTARGDWLKELRNPEKRAPFVALSNQFWFVIAEGIGSKDDMPPDTADCGLLEIMATGRTRIRTRKKAPLRDVGDIPTSFAMAMMRTVRERPIPQRSRIYVSRPAW
ncbi:hypothetical protein LCGC14_0520530 [marine sediment metagenome]|uniref:Uncharacterized protein n=1 Tax=marine sediment metagenome TaxID=412755 RepID=A0A0F9RYR3_9ZZZZ